MRKNLFYLIMIIFIFSMLIISCKEKENGNAGITPLENTAPDPDAVQAAPSLYKVLADTMGLRLLEVNYNPGDSSAMHKHADLAVYVVGGGSNTFKMKDGTTEVRDVTAGMSFVMPAQSHSVKNTGSTALKAILVEVNRTGAVTAPDASTDATKVSPGLYKTTTDTLGIRIVEVNYAPGQSSPMHAHPDNAIYVVEGGKVEFTLKDGTKTVSELPAGAAMIRPAEAHAAKNIGKNNLRVILVEVNRAMQ